MCMDSNSGRRTVPLPHNWPSIRKYVLQRDGMCMWGLLEDDEPFYLLGQCTNTHTDVDHIDDPSVHDPSNLRALCAWHHATRTGRQGAAARWGTRRQHREPHPGMIE